MEYFNFLCQGSENHRVKLEKNEIHIFPIDSSREALEKFQPIVHQAIETASEEGYVLVHQQESSQYSDNLIDELVFVEGK